MKQINQYNKLKNATILLLNCGNEIGLMKEAVDQMYSVYSHFSSVDISCQNDDEIILPSGKAISPSTAAQCLFDIKRTAKFIRGINEAIKQKRNKKLTPVQILYAGCGPYAALITPILTKFGSKEINVDFLDINPVSLSSAQSILKGLNFNKSIGYFLLEDASQLKIEKAYDIIISETMQAGLRSEPQVAIMQNFFPQMKPEAIFIPEEIIIEAKLNTRGNWNPEKLKVENEERINLGEVMRVNKQTIKNVLRKTTINFCKSTDELLELKLYTTIKIFNNENLMEGDSGLNSPLKLLELSEDLDYEIGFEYNQSYPSGIVATLENNLVII